MSYKLAQTAACTPLPKGTVNTKSVFVTICGHANEATGWCWLSIETIAEEANTSTRSVQRALAELADCNLEESETVRVHA